MGVVATINHDLFPAQNEERLGKETEVHVKLHEGNTVTLKGTIVRSDVEFPNREIVELNADHFPDNVCHYHDNVSREHHPEEFSFMENVTGKYCFEGRFFNIMFHYSDKKVRGICLFDRGPLTLFKILEGTHDGKIISATECQYSHAD